MPPLRTKPDTTSGRDVVVVAVEEDDRLLGDDTRRTEISDRAEGGESEGADDAHVVDLGR